MGTVFVFRAALHMVISDFKVFIVFVALGLPFPQVHLSVGGGGGGGGVNRWPLAVEFPQVLLVIYIILTSHFGYA